MEHNRLSSLLAPQEHGDEISSLSALGYLYSPMFLTYSCCYRNEARAQISKVDCLYEQSARSKPYFDLSCYIYRP